MQYYFSFIIIIITTQYYFTIIIIIIIIIIVIIIIIIVKYTFYIYLLWDHISIACTFYLFCVIIWIKKIFTKIMKMIKWTNNFYYE